MESRIMYRKPDWKGKNDHCSQRKRVPPPVSHVNGTWNRDLWSIRFDGQHVMAIMLEFPKFTVVEITTAIRSEGGSVDDSMIVHRG